MTRHRCDTCGARHDAPKVHRVPMAIGQAVAFGVVEVLAALRLDGWLAIGLWVIAAWNALFVALLIWGLAQLVESRDEVSR